ncbi:TPA: hypothetical protein NKQ30_004521 [Vibrio parahaemolyticus]|nr:hypothetical protein [Vibrio parahaemolyticus]
MRIYQMVARNFNSGHIHRIIRKNLEQGEKLTLRDSTALIWFMLSEQKSFRLSYQELQLVHPKLRKLLPLERKLCHRTLTDGTQVLDTVRFYSETYARRTLKLLKEHGQYDLLAELTNGQEQAFNAMFEATQRIANAWQSDMLD